jgi:hypothetical protein
MGGACSIHERNSYKMFVRKPEWKRLLEGHRHTREDNVNMHLTEISLEDVDWIQLTEWPACLNTVIDLRVP